jgi:putative ABC transport system permease protein
VDTLRQDLRYAARSLLNARATTLVAVLCLALGIGANTAIFSVVRAVLLDALPYAAPDRLVNVNEFGARGPGSVSTPMYHDVEAQTALFSGVSAWTGSARDLGDVADPERLQGIRATTNLFSTLGVGPLIGRTFAQSDDPLTGQPVVVLSEALWRGRFGGDRAILGKQITLSGRKYTVIGVMPESFDFPVSPMRMQFWEPLDFRIFGDLTNRGNRSLNVVARLATGVDSAKAMAGLATLSQRLAVEFPVTNKGRGLLVRGAISGAVGAVRPALLVLLAAVGLVLLIACANVANLTLVRAAGRRREVAIRTALGAERSRLIRQLLTESALLAVLGGALGLVVAWWGLHALLGASRSILPHHDQISMQSSVLIFATIVSLVTGLGVGLVPAVRASQPDLRGDLSDGAGKSSVSSARQRTLKTLIVGEIALSVVLLTGAGLVIRSFVALTNVDAGFNPDGVIKFALGAPPGTIDTMRYVQVFQPVAERLRALSGVRAVGMTNVLPVSGGMTDRFFNIVGKPYDNNSATARDAQYRTVSPDYFRTMGIQFVRGRDFSEQDTRHTPPVTIVNEELVRRFFPGENPIGQQIDMGGPMTIVGVVRAVREVGLDNDLLPEFYVPVAQRSEGTSTLTFVVSTSGDPSTLSTAVRDAVRSVVPQQPIYGLATMRAVLRDSLGTRRLLLMLLGLFAGLALLLSAAGVYGVMAYGVAQRTREIGIRIALGASAGETAAIVLRDVAAVAALGLLVGIAAAVGASRLITSVLYGVGALDVVTFVSVPMVIGVVAFMAGAIPAWRATRIDPLIAMRSE